MNRIAVFCGSKHGTDPAYNEASKLLGKTLANKKITLVYGGGAVGLMGVIAESVLAHGGEVIGVIPEKLYEMEVAHMGLTELYRVKTMHERKALMADLSDGFIAMPGGIGTLEEITEVMTWAQIGYHTKPSAFLNVNGYFDEFVAFFDKMEKKGFLYVPIHEQVIIETDVEQLMNRMLEY